VVFGYWLGAAVGILTFISAYVYCIATYGCLLGVGLGWLPAMIVAAVACGLTIFLWGPAVVLLLIVLVWVMK
jgi:hypothetical protein